MGNYTFNKSEDKILIATNTQSIYRYSTKSVYYIFNIKTKELSNLSKNNVMYATFSPNGKNIAYVFNNNLYVYNLLTGITKQITFDGSKNNIINGASLTGSMKKNFLSFVHLNGVMTVKLLHFINLMRVM